MPTGAREAEYEGNVPAESVPRQIPHAIRNGLEVYQTIIHPSTLRILRNMIQQGLLAWCGSAKEDFAVTVQSGIYGVQTRGIDHGVRVLEGFGA